MSACLLCGSQARTPLFTVSDRQFRTTTRSFEVCRCVECGLIRLHPMPRGEELAGYYPERYWFSPGDNGVAKLEEKYRRLVLRDHLAFVAGTLREAGAGPLLDAGCGGGLFAGMLRERGVEAMGLDISERAAAVARRRQGVPAVCGKLTESPFAPASCAVVTMFHVLEHLPDPRPHLLAARALLRPPGRLVVQVPNADCWQFRLLGRAWNGLDVPRHLYDFRARDLERLLEACGFQVVRRKYFSLRDNPAGLATSLAPGLDPMTRHVRGAPESAGTKLARDLLYFALVAAALPAAALEAACRAGSTVMMEARLR
jgi:SAM-dependent methyltransferase